MESLLDRKSEHDFLGKLVLVSDDRSSSDYFLHYFISQAIKDDYCLCLISVTQTLSHYSTIATKLGTNLKAACSKGQFSFVQVKSYAASSEEHDRDIYSCYIESSLDSLYGVVKEIVSLKSKPVCLVIDDLSVLLSIGVPLKELIVFINYISRLLLHGDSDKLGYLVIRVHCDNDVEDNDELFLYTHLLHQSHYHIHTQGLPTGYSRDIHGEVMVEKRDPLSISQPETRSMQYRNLDRTISLFPKGLSRIVL